MLFGKQRPAAEVRGRRLRADGEQPDGAAAAAREGPARPEAHPPEPPAANQTSLWDGALRSYNLPPGLSTAGV